MIDLSVEKQVKIPFQDVDVMGVVWHGNYLRYFEEARAELLDKIDYGYLEMRNSGYSWPVVDVRIKYIKPLLLQQTVVVIATLLEHECRLKIGYEIRDAISGERLTKGYTIQVAVDINSREMCFTTPRVLCEKLRKIGCQE